MTDKKKDLEDLKILAPNDTEEPSDGELEIKPTPSPVKKKKVYNVKPKDPDAPKRPLTEKQKENWAKCLAVREAKRKERKTEQTILKEQIEVKKKEAKKAVEDKVVRKAISIKKKQIKAEAMLDHVSDDETPIEEVKQILRKQPPRKVNMTPVPERPVFTFV